MGLSFGEGEFIVMGGDSLVIPEVPANKVDFTKSEGLVFITTKTLNDIKLLSAILEESISSPW